MNKSIYKYAAEAGLPFGMYLCLISCSFFMSVRIDILSMLIIPLCVGIPIFLGILMKRIAKQEPSYMKFSALWLGGIYTVIFGTLICCLFSSVYLMFIDPGFIHNYIMNAITLMENSPMASQYEATTSLMRNAMESHILPSTTEFISMMGWFTCFAGSIMSMLLSLIIVKSGNRKRRLLTDN